MENMAQFEAMCERLYNSPDSAERAYLESTFKSFSHDVSCIAQCEYILESARTPYAVLLASSSLMKQVTENKLSLELRLQIRDHLVNYLASRGSSLESFVTASLLQLLCRLTKIGWLDDDRFKELVNVCASFLDQDTYHWEMSLKLLNQLVLEINVHNPDLSVMQHRKIACSFRDESLLQTYQISLSSLGKFKSDGQSKLQELALSLSFRCLSFDFIGTYYDETSDEVGTVQIPSSWASVMEEPATLQIYFDYYAITNPPLSKQALECLVLLASVRRAMFESSSSHSKYLAAFMLATKQVMETGKGLGDHDNYHEFCRLLGRFKAHYQLSELVNREEYSSWLGSVAEFTMTSLRSWKWAGSSVYYLLGLWSRMVQSVPYYKGDAPSHLDAYVPVILKSFVSSRFDAPKDDSADETFEEPLDNVELLQDQLEFFPYLCRFQYETCGAHIMQIMDPMLQVYMGGSSTQSQTDMNLLETIENQLAWMVHMVASTLRIKQSYSSSGELAETIDAEIAARLLKLITIMDSGLYAQRYHVSSKQRLDLAVLSFFQSLKRSYIGDQAAYASSKFYTRLSALVGIHDHLMLLNFMVQKISTNLKCYLESIDVIDQTLSLFLDMASGYMAAKLLLKLDAIQHIMFHHGRDNFPFLDDPSASRTRTTFYHIIGLLVFWEENVPSTFKRSMEPLSQVLVTLESTPDAMFRYDATKFALIGLMRDLRGICLAAGSRKAYGSLFNWLCPSHIQLLVKAIMHWADTPEVTTPLLKFMAEFAQNKSQRITFDSSSPNGILLFRDVSKLIVAYGSRILSIPNQSDPYEFKYKGIWISLTMLSAALTGNYVNFGVFELYGDTAHIDALHIALRLILSIPFADVLAYKKVMKAYFRFVEILFSNHLKYVLNLDVDTFSYLAKSLESGLQVLDTSIVSQCASTIDHLGTYYFNHIVMGEAPASPIALKFAQNMSNCPEVFPNMLKSLFEIVLFEDRSNRWNLSRPMLSLILMSQEMLNHVKAQILASMSTNQQIKLQQCFENLMADVAPNLESSTRDRFSSNLTRFSNEFRAK